jgi:hypothetical protein
VGVPTPHRAERNAAADGKIRRRKCETAALSAVIIPAEIYRSNAEIGSVRRQK